jgi:hypothetical protein
MLRIFVSWLARRFCDHELISIDMHPSTLPDGTRAQELWLRCNHCPWFFYSGRFWSYPRLHAAGLVEDGTPTLQPMQPQKKTMVN